MNREALAWAAGFFDGEGSTMLQRHPSGRVYPRVCIAQKDRKLLDKLAEIVGVRSSMRLPTVGRPHSCHQLEFSGFERCQVVISLLWRWLGEPKREQAKRVFRAFIEQGGHGNFQARKTHCPRGHPYSDENVIARSGKKRGRRCRQCYNAQARDRRARKRAAAAASVDGRRWTLSG